MKLIIRMTLAGALLFAACSKNTSQPSNNNNPNPTPSKPPKELITGTWTYVSVTSDDPDNPSPLDTCAWDDLTTFKSDGTWLPDHNGSICDTYATNIPGTWNVDNYPTLTWKHPNWTFKQENKIIQLDATTLKFERRYPDVNSHVMTFVMKRK